MANLIKQTKLTDGTKRTVLKYVANVDTIAANATLLDISSLAFSLNANGQILGAGTDKLPLYRTNIKRIWGQGQFKSGGYAALLWGTSLANGNTEIVTFGAGQFDYNFDAEGLSCAIPTPTSNSNGHIYISTVGVAAGDAFTLFIDLKKDARDFDSGKTADPTAFNVRGISPP